MKKSLFIQSVRGQLPPVFGSTYKGQTILFFTLQYLVSPFQLSKVFLLKF
jgi:hypothetical protein